MPKLSPNAIPAYRQHKASGQAIVTLDGRDVYLGEHGSPASREKYNRLTAEWLANGRRLPQATPDLTIIELVDRFWQHADEYYPEPDGGGTSEAARYRDALKVLVRLYGSALARDFGPLKLKAVQGEMIRLGWCRKNINRSINRIRHAFKWAAGNELVPAGIHQALTTVAGLKAGRSEARESDPVPPVPQAVVDATLPHLSDTVAAMVRLQLLTGMRPGEVCKMRACEMEMPDNDLWLYHPAGHKTAHHGHRRLIYIGPKAKEIVLEHLKPNPQAYLFSPADAVAERSESGRPSRAKRRPRKTPGARYTASAYGKAIAYACDAAFPPPAPLARIRVAGGGRKAKGERWETRAEWRARLDKIGPEKWAERQRWADDHRWAPNQLRHTAATELRRQYGIEAAQVILGHKTLTVTEVYAEKNVAAAKKIMGQVG